MSVSVCVRVCVCARSGLQTHSLFLNKPSLSVIVHPQAVIKSINSHTRVHHFLSFISPSFLFLPTVPPSNLRNIEKLIQIAQGRSF